MLFSAMSGGFVRSQKACPSSGETKANVTVPVSSSIEDARPSNRRRSSCGSPIVSHRHHAVRPRDWKEFGCRALWSGCKHRAKHRRHDIEAVVGKRKLLGVGLLPL